MDNTFNDLQYLYDCVNDVIEVDNELNLNLECVNELKKAYKKLNSTDQDSPSIKELNFKYYDKADQFEFEGPLYDYSLTIEGPENNKTLAHHIIILDVWERKAKGTEKLGDLPINSHDFDNIHELEYELQIRQNFSHKQARYIIEQVKKGGLID